MDAEGILDILNKICDAYDDEGYKVMEFIVPLEWKKKIDKITPCKPKTPLSGSVIENEFAGVVKVFPSQSRHFQVIVG
jgi:hypothetical protein